MSRQVRPTLQASSRSLAPPAPAHHLEGLAGRLVVDLDAVLDARLALELEDEHPTPSTRVPPLERGQTEAAVLVGVDVVADPEVAEVEQPDRDGAAALAAHPLRPEVGRDPLPGPGERLAEVDDADELGVVARPSPGRVVEVLPPPGVVRAHRLEVAARVRADPHVLPRGRDHQVLAALHLVGCEPLATLVEIDESLACAASRPARVALGRTTQAWHDGHVAGALSAAATPSGG